MQFLIGPDVSSGSRREKLQKFRAVLQEIHRNRRETEFSESRIGNWFSANLRELHIECGIGTSVSGTGDLCRWSIIQLFGDDVAFQYRFEK